MKLFLGHRTHEGIRTVHVDGLPLPERRDLCDYTHTGLDWGFIGPGPSQLAMALASAVLGEGEANDRKAVILHNGVKKLVEKLAHGHWAISSADVLQFMTEKEPARSTEGERYSDMRERRVTSYFSKSDTLEEKMRAETARHRCRD